MNIEKNYRNWRLKVDESQILWLYFDKESSSVNTIDRNVMEEFSNILDDLVNETTYKGLIIASGKKTGFIAGADISLFTTFRNIEEATNILLRGQEILRKLESLPLKTVAMIDGFCLGGGLELALACQYRVAEESAKTRLGLPEIKLGIYPGWGGTVRLPRKIGALNALNLILSGSTVSGKVAAKLGIVDSAVPRRQLIHAAKYYILNATPARKLNWLQSFYELKLIRQVIATYLRKQVRKKVNPMHYPAPYQVIDNWEQVGTQTDEAYIKEAKGCGKLFLSDTCHNLVRVFFLQERLKGLAKNISFSPKHIHVIGAGTMGGDIAAWCALRGFTVTLQDLEPRFITPAIKRAYGLFKDKLKENYLVQAAMDRLIPDLNGLGISKADVVIEAVIEDLTVKQGIFRQIEENAKPHAIIATNTSSIPLDDINSVLALPNRLVGIHFFNPVSKMLLVEVVKGEQTSDETFEKAISFVRQIDRLPLPVKSSPGFLVNRILMPYLLESMDLLNEGVPAPVIDKAMTDFGMPMGPITLADTVGLDVCLSVANYLGKYFDTPIPQRLITLVNEKKLGRKTGEGFYQYDKHGKQIKSSANEYNQPLDAIANRLILRLLNEAFACLREGVVADSDLLDAGMIFGTGFAPFRGGPIHYAKTQGIQELYEQFILQQKAKGEKIVANQSWEEMVE